MKNLRNRVLVRFFKPHHFFFLIVNHRLWNYIPKTAWSDPFSPLSKHLEPAMLSELSILLLSNFLFYAAIEPYSVRDPSSW